MNNTDIFWVIPLGLVAKNEFQNTEIGVFALFFLYLISNYTRFLFYINAPFHCFGQVIIFNKWEGGSLTWKRKSLLRIITCWFYF